MSNKIYGIPVTTPFNPNKIAGAYYTPEVSQVDENTMRVSFVPQKEGMPEIPDQVITLPVGPQGPKGADGTMTFEDLTDEQKAGLKGDTGPAGPQGEKGDKGDKGNKGDTGATGPAGADGAQGPKGDKGDTGATGPAGPKGETGPQGEKGDKGDKGDTGPAPVKGTDYFTPAEVDAVAAQAAGKVTPEAIGARPNTWLPTLAEIGAAPSGYGLGESVGRYCADCHAVSEGGLYYVDNSTSNLPAVGASGVLLVQNIPTANGNDIYLTLTSGVNIWHCYYSSWAKTWQPWECENPPMALGVEYRTTERYNGNPVYTISVNYGKGSSVVPFHINLHHIIGTNVKFIDAICKAQGENGWSTFIEYPNLSFAEQGSNNALFVVSDGGLAEFDVYLTVKYYKV